MLAELHGHLGRNQSRIPSYAERHRAGEPISSATAEGAVNQLIAKRMVKKQQMRWTPQGAHRILQIRTHQLDIAGKANRYRAIPLLEPVLDRINIYQAERKQRFSKHRLERRTTPLLVHPTSGKAMTTRQVQYFLDRLYRQAGVRSQVPPGALVHALRHTFAMDLLDNGASIVEVQALLGHESIATTRRYLTARPHQLKDAITATETNAALRRTSATAEDDR